jgi:hypothetical protein
MRISSVVLVVAVFSMPFLTSCASTGATTFMKAGFEQQDNEGWASKYLPGISFLSKLLPPPTEARLEWDERQKRMGQPGWGQDHYPDLQ